jgi:Holliday junction resolvase RusA-like endonuclease
MKPAPTEWTAASVPLPPSVNASFRNVADLGRTRTAAYNRWRDNAGWLVKSMKPPTFDGPFSVEIVAPQAMRLDIDNIIKPLVDLLVWIGVTPDDKHMSEVVCRRSATRPLDIGCMIIVRAA